MSEPGYWQYETSGVLRPAIEAYLRNETLTGEQIAAMRAYLRQWIKASVWDENPHAGEAEREWLTASRQAIDELTSQDAISDWLAEAEDHGMDPL